MKKKNAVNLNQGKYSLVNFITRYAELTTESKKTLLDYMDYLLDGSQKKNEVKKTVSKGKTSIKVDLEKAHESITPPGKKPTSRGRPKKVITQIKESAQ